MPVIQVESLSLYSISSTIHGHLFCGWCRGNACNHLWATIELDRHLDDTLSRVSKVNFIRKGSFTLVFPRYLCGTLQLNRYHKNMFLLCGDIRRVPHHQNLAEVETLFFLAPYSILYPLFFQFSPTMKKNILLFLIFGFYISFRSISSSAAVPLFAPPPADWAASMRSRVLRSSFVRPSSSSSTPV